MFFPPDYDFSSFPKETIIRWLIEANKEIVRLQNRSIDDLIQEKIEEAISHASKETED